MAFTVLLVGVIPAAPWRLRIAASATTGGADLAKAARESVRLAFPGLPRLPMKIALANGVPVDLDKTLEEQGIESGDTLRVRFYDPSLDAVDTDGGAFTWLAHGDADGSTHGQRTYLRRTSTSSTVIHRMLLQRHPRDL